MKRKDTAPVVEKTQGSVGSSACFDSNLLRVYYDRLFPFHEMSTWLAYGVPAPGTKESDEFSRREFSFTLDNDIYVRYQSFETEKEFRNEVKKRNPFKIDIGAVYNDKPSMRTALTRFFPEKREFVFDIDISDYDDIRPCCSGADICSLCWTYMTAALLVLQRALTEDFGFKHILWVFSGRRGIHCWVSDEAAQRLDDEQRAKLVNYFHYYTGGEKTSEKVYIEYPIHPAAEKAYNILEPIFVKFCVLEQEVFSYDAYEAQIVNFPAAFADKVRKQFRQNILNGAERWLYLKKNVGQLKNGVTFLYQIVFTHLYPRLDANVSKQRNHLLKSPFVVHPKTGFVCVPIDPDHCHEFNPMHVPNLVNLNQELNQHREGSDTSKGRPMNIVLIPLEYQSTSMKEYIDYFRSSFLKPLIATTAAAARESRISLHSSTYHGIEADSLDF